MNTKVINNIKGFKYNMLKLVFTYYNIKEENLNNFKLHIKETIKIYSISNAIIEDFLKDNPELIEYFI